MVAALVSRISSLWRGRKATTPAVFQVILYTRQGCHLCEIAREQLQKIQQQFPFALASVDVDGDPELAAKFGDQVPVVSMNGKVRFHGCINEVLLIRLLRAESTNRK